MKFEDVCYSIVPPKVCYGANSMVAMVARQPKNARKMTLNTGHDTLLCLKLLDFLIIPCKTHC